MLYDLKFVTGSQEDYDSLAEKEVGTFYYIDEKKLYLGENLLNDTPNDWELIQDISIQEDCGYISYNVDLNGNPFNLKKAIIYVYRTTTSVPELAVSLDASVQGSPWNNGDWVRWKLNGTTGVHATYIEKLSNQQIIVNSIQSAANDAMLYNLIMKSSDTHFWTYTPKKIYADMTALNVGSWDAALPAGSRILLYGIREEE